MNRVYLEGVTKIPDMKGLSPKYSEIYWMFLYSFEHNIHNE